MIRHRMSRAAETLLDARLLFDNGSYNACVNRLYYSCFYSVSALLLSEGLTSSKHSGIRSLFLFHFARTNRIERRYARFYNSLYADRGEGDYLDFKRFERDEVEAMFSEAGEFIARVRGLIDLPGTAGGAVSP